MLKYQYIVRNDYSRYSNKIAHCTSQIYLAPSYWCSLISMIRCLNYHLLSLGIILNKPIRFMVGLLIWKQLENLSDEAVILQWKRNPYYQAFCRITEFQSRLPCHSAELVHFHKRIGMEGIEKKIFQMSLGFLERRRLKTRSILIPLFMKRTSSIPRTAS